MDNSFPHARLDDTLTATTISLLDLPLETTLDISSYLDKNDIKALRSTCKQMDTYLVDGFGK